MLGGDKVLNLHERATTQILERFIGILGWAQNVLATILSHTIKSNWHR